MSQGFTYFEKKIVPSDEAKISVQTHALQYGTAVLGGIRGYYNAEENNIFVFRIQDHYKRLLDSAKIMQLNYQSNPDALTEITLDLIQKNGYRENIYIRPYIYTSALQLSPRFHDVKADIAIYILKLNDYLDTKKGLTTMVSSWRRMNDDMIPSLAKTSGGYVNSALAKSEAVQNGCDEAIFLDSRGYVSEGSAENIFLVRQGNIVTPSLGSSILEGITRRTVMELAQTKGYQIIERNIARSELYVADEIFLSGTGVQLAWVRSVDHRVVGEGKIGPVSEEMQNLYFNVVTGRVPAFHHWLTKVY